MVNFWICNRNYYVWVVYIACHDFNFNIFGSKTTISKHTFGCPSDQAGRLPFCLLYHGVYQHHRVEQLLIQSNISLIHRGVHHRKNTSHSSFELETGWNQFGSFFCDFCCLDLAKVSFQKFKFFTSSLIDIRGLVGRVIFIKPFFVYLVCFAYYVRLNITFRTCQYLFVTIIICYRFHLLPIPGSPDVFTHPDEYGPSSRYLQNRPLFGPY